MNVYNYNDKLYIFNNFSTRNYYTLFVAVSYDLEAFEKISKN